MPPKGWGRVPRGQHWHMTGTFVRVQVRIARIVQVIAHLVAEGRVRYCHVHVQHDLVRVRVRVG